MITKISKIDHVKEARRQDCMIEVSKLLVDNLGPF